MDQGKADFEECFDEADKSVSLNFPSDSDKPLPANPELEMRAQGPGHHVQNHIESSLEQDSVQHHVKGHVLGSPSSSPSNWQNVTLTMPGAFPKEDDSYLCSGFRVKDWINEVPVYITKFKVETTANKVHHLIIQGCAAPVKPPGEIW